MYKQNLTIDLSNLSVDPSYSSYTAVANIFDNIKPEDRQMPSLKVAILRNFTLDPIIPVIKGEIALSGFHPEIYLGDYDVIARDVFNPDSPLYKFQPSVIIVAQWLDTLSPVLAERFLSLSSGQVNSEIERIIANVNEFISVLRKHTNAPILVNNFPLPSYSTLGILDIQSDNYQTNTILKLNSQLLHSLRKTKDVYLVNYMSLMARIGAEQGLDERYWQIGRAPLGRNALVPIGQEYGKFFRALHGKTRKCLVLDCDNILWGGVIGEDGLEGIKLGKSYPGSCYRVFQQEILNLHDRGVILALCSKNNETDVLEVLRKHPDAVLKEDNFSTWQINWDDKVTNLKRIAHDLNISLDSLVFIDDSKFECNLVREQLPDVAVLELSSEPSTFKAKLIAKGYFDSLIISSEDRKRNQMYRDQVKRTELSSSADSLEGYLSKLGMTVEIGLADDKTISRISQLTQKTNQFNLTTRRYSEGDICAFVQNPHADVFYIKLRDLISDMGLIGVAILKYNGEQADIDTFLLSCRAIGRNVEDALLAHVINSAKAKGCSRILGHYLMTNKNNQAADYYSRQGFSLLKKSEQGSDWELSLDNKMFSCPAWIKIV